MTVDLPADGNAKNVTTYWPDGSGDSNNYNYDGNDCVIGSG